MSTLQQIRNQFLATIKETTDNSHFTTSEINALINEAIKAIGVKVNYPRDMVQVQVQQSVGAYPIPSDFVFLYKAYFGDVNLPNDVKPLTILDEETLSQIYPNWLDETSGTESRPHKLIMLDKNTMFIYPRPNADESATGKKLIYTYVYVPASLSNDSDVPDLPPAYHDTIQYYAAGLAYLGGLQNPSMAAAMFGLFDKEVAQRSVAAEKEAEEVMRFKWGYMEQ